MRWDLIQPYRNSQRSQIRENGKAVFLIEVVASALCAELSSHRLDATPSSIVARGTAVSFYLSWKAPEGWSSPRRSA